MEISKYKKRDTAEIEQLFTQVFSDSEGPEEGSLIGSLVLDLMTSTEAVDLFGFVATEGDQIIGGIFFTRLVFERSEDAFILSPVAIHTDYQGKGVGQSLIRHGLRHLKDAGVGLAFTYGDPKYYSKVGFECITEAIAKAPFELSQPEGWLCQSLVGDEIRPIAGNSRCVEALNKALYW